MSINFYVSMALSIFFKRQKLTFIITTKKCDFFYFVIFDVTIHVVYNCIIGGSNIIKGTGPG